MPPDAVRLLLLHSLEASSSDEEGPLEEEVEDTAAEAAAVESRPRMCESTPMARGEDRGEGEAEADAEAEAPMGAVATAALGRLGCGDWKTWRMATACGHPSSMRSSSAVSIAWSSSLPDIDSMRPV